MEDGIAKQPAAERKKITEQESARARQQVEEKLNAERETAGLQSERLQELNRKLTLAQKAETDLLKKATAGRRQERELERDLQTGIAAARSEERAKVLAEVQSDLDLKVQDRDNRIAQLLTQIDSLKRKAEQSSQQAQGESLEVALEHQLRAQFSLDLIEPVAKGEFGGDVLQHVRDQSGQLCEKFFGNQNGPKSGRIPGLPSLKAISGPPHADLAVIVSQTMPKDLRHSIIWKAFGYLVWDAYCRLPTLFALASLNSLVSAFERRTGDQSPADLRLSDRSAFQAPYRVSRREVHRTAQRSGQGTQMDE